jgi:myo-inositol-1(or 4)-monophosphatase
VNPEQVRDCLEAGLAAVLEAGPIALEYFRQDPTVDDKRPGGHFDPVTEADRRVEQVIRERLSRSFPGHRIVGEEHGESGRGATYWIIDPIDGTRSFISGMPTWGILLGLVDDGRPVAGIMHQPYTGETWFADRGSGARLYAGGRERPLRTRQDTSLDQAILFSTDPRLLVDPATRDGYERLAARCRLQRFGGDCYGFVLVASGCIDLMVDGSLMPYDIVPLIPIVEEAGGVITDLAGRTPMDGGTVIAAANASLHAAALELLNTRPR